MRAWLDQIFQHPELAQMGHAQRAADANLGLGWIYYGLVRAMRPATVVVIGSWRGFTPLVFGKALGDNLEGGEVVLIEPSLVDEFWKNPQQVGAWFAKFGVDNVRHYRMTTQEFTASAAYRSLGAVGIVFIDGYHTLEQAAIDYEAFRDLVCNDGLIIFHDSRHVRTSAIYGTDKIYLHRVKEFVAHLAREPGLQLLDLPIGDGITLLRKHAGG